MTDDDLRAAYAAHLGRPAPADARACPSPEELLALVRREGPEAQRLTVLDHVMGCADCRREFDLLRAVEAARSEAGGRGARAGAQHGQHVARRWAGPVGFALAASLVLAIGVRQYHGRTAADGAADALRGADDGIALVTPAARGALPLGAPARFVWRATPGATRYDFEILAPDGTSVVTATTADTTVTLPDARRLVPGTTYQWWVRAVGDAGGAPRRSALRAFHTTPR